MYKKSQLYWLPKCILESKRSFTWFEL